MKELENVQTENIIAMEDKMKIVDRITTVEKDIYSSSRELQELRVNYN